jgi:hypothetical protein
MELGERTAKIEGKQGERNNFVLSSNEVEPSKIQQLSELGISKQRASEYEQLVKPENRPIVERFVRNLTKRAAAVSARKRGAWGKIPGAGLSEICKPCEYTNRHLSEI